MATLILLRHGQSQWNLENRFTGWTDVDLSPKGEEQARLAGRLIADAGLSYDLAFTSMLTRAIRTLWLAMESAGRVWPHQEAAWQLNERHYGALQGLDKAETAAQHGDEQVRIWRRSYDVPPPPLDDLDPRHPRFDPRYAGLGPEALPSAESLKDTLGRVLPYWESAMAPRLRQGLGLIVAAHGNSLRALVKHLEGVSDQDIPLLEIPTGNPLVYELDPGLGVISRRYLDPQRRESLPGEIA